jgi:hypothetical protein
VKAPLGIGLLDQCVVVQVGGVGGVDPGQPEPTGQCPQVDVEDNRATGTGCARVTALMSAISPPPGRYPAVTGGAAGHQAAGLAVAGFTPP